MTTLKLRKPIFAASVALSGVFLPVAQANPDSLPPSGQNSPLKDIQPKGVNDFKLLASYANGGATVLNKVSRLNEYRLNISDRSAAAYLGFYFLDKGLGNEASSSEEFVGFSQSLNEVETVHVFPETEGLKVKVERKPYFFCVYTRVISYPDTRYVKTPLAAGAAGPAIVKL